MGLIRARTSRITDAAHPEERLSQDRSANRGKSIAYALVSLIVVPCVGAVGYIFVVSA
jgi:hypothetical protein